MSPALSYLPARPATHATYLPTPRKNRFFADKQVSIAGHARSRDALRHRVSGELQRGAFEPARSGRVSVTLVAHVVRARVDELPLRLRHGLTSPVCRGGFCDSDRMAFEAGRASNSSLGRVSRDDR